MGRRIAKVDQDPISHVLRQMAIIALDHRLTGLSVNTDDVTIFFEVELLRQ
jgi:hypothetical protein